MGRETERKALLTHLKDIWVPDFGLVAWPNVAFKTPKDARWASVAILSYPSNRASLGGFDFLNRHHGSLQIDLFSPSGIGTKENRVAADFLEGHFDSLVLVTEDGERIEFETPYSFEPSAASERQEGTNENWSRRIVDCPFYRDSRVVK